MVACLPDQLLLAHTSIQGVKSVPLSDITSGANSTEKLTTLNARLNFTSRPCNPLEPLVLGLISIIENTRNTHNTIVSTDSTEQSSVRASSIVVPYVPCIDPYTGIATPPRERGPLIPTHHIMPKQNEIGENFFGLRSLVTLFCPSRPTPGIFYSLLSL